MTPQQTLRQIKKLTEALVGLSLSNEQNFPSVHGNTNAAFEITVSTAAGMSVALKNVAYRDFIVNWRRRAVSILRCWMVH